MSQIVPFSQPTPYLLRGTPRKLAQLQQRTDYSVAVLESTAQVAAAKADVLGFVATQALQGVAFVSQVESALAIQCPQASGRLAMIADSAAWMYADLVQQTARQIRYV